VCVCVFCIYLSYLHIGIDLCRFIRSNKTGTALTRTSTRPGNRGIYHLRRRRRIKRRCIKLAGPPWPSTLVHHTSSRTHHRQLHTPLLVLCNNDYTCSDIKTRRKDELLQGPDRSVLRGRVRRARQSCRCGHRDLRRRRDQGLTDLHEAVR